MQESVQLSVKESVGEILRDRWTRYIVASMLIHGAMFSVPSPFPVPRFAGPIEVFLLEGPGSFAPSGNGAEKKDRSQSKPRLEIRGPMGREGTRTGPQEISGPIEQKPGPVQSMADNITAREPAPRNDPVGEIQLKSEVTAGSGQEEKARILPPEPSKPIEQKVKPVQAATDNIIVPEPPDRSDSAGRIQPQSEVTVASRREEKPLLPSSSGTATVIASTGGIGAVKKETASLSGSGTGIPSDSGQGIGTGKADTGFGSPSGSGTGAGSGSGRGIGTGDADAGFGSLSGPRFLHQVIPEYPYMARKRRIEGKVVISVVIDETGRLAKAEVIEASNEAFANASLEALKKSTFLPATRNGQPVTSRAILPIRFSLVE